MTQRYDEETWAQVVRRAPLVSFDLLVTRQERVLVGWRTNRPAQASWFVPGGVIRKGESLAQAFSRVTADELGKPFALADSTLHGVYEHFYDDNFRNEPGYGTHYVVLARILPIVEPLSLPDDQHSRYQWLTQDELLAHPDVHPNVKEYYRA